MNTVNLTQKQHAIINTALDHYLAHLLDTDRHDRTDVTMVLDMVQRAESVDLFYDDGGPQTQTPNTSDEGWY